MVSRERLYKLLDYNPMTGELFWKYRPNGPTQWNNVNAGQPAGSKSCGLISIDKRNYRITHIIWFYHYGKWPPNEVDHIDLNHLNDAISNLRLATSTQQKANRRIYSNNTTGVKGVKRRDDKFIAAVGTQYIGIFDNIEDATKARQKAFEQKYGEFARHK